MKNSNNSKKRFDPDELALPPPNDEPVRKKKKKKRQEQTQSDEQESLQDLLTRLHIKEWDFLVVGDGSGSNWGYPAGWAAVSIENTTLARQEWWGTVNRGTVNFAEIMAYMQFLNWLGAREDDRRANGKRRRVLNVHIITDSQYCERTGSSAVKGNVRKNSVLWAAFDVFARQGILLHWHWLKREDIALNQYADKLSKLARGLAKRHNLRKRLERNGRTLHQHNPDERGDV